eukprot:scaffold178119_cov27-Prasinocladus_malaysianus.AAC.1
MGRSATETQPQYSSAPIRSAYCRLEQVPGDTVGQHVHLQCFTSARHRHSDCHWLGGQNDKSMGHSAAFATRGSPPRAHVCGKARAMVAPSRVPAGLLFL